MGHHRLVLPDGRTLSWDDVGDPTGVPVVYLHGNPDARQARHPDDGIAAGCGVRLLALDRPGFGDSTLHPGASIGALAADLAVLLDELDLPRAGLFGWSSGGLAALAAAAGLGDRVDRVLTVATLPPAEAYAEAALVAALGPTRQPFAELATELEPAELAAEIAPYLVPDPLTEDLAREHVLEGAGPVGRAELALVPGAVDQLVAGLVGAVRQGIAGLEQDLRHQLEPGVDLAAICVPVRLVHGTEDGVAPPAVGRWIADRVSTAVVEEVDGGGHHLLFPRWELLMRSCLGDVPG